MHQTQSLREVEGPQRRRPAALQLVCQPRLVFFHWRGAGLGARKRVGPRMGWRPRLSQSSAVGYYIIRSIEARLAA